MSSYPADAAAETGTVESRDDGRTLAPDAIFDVLADRRRRYALYYLFGCAYPVDVGELAEVVAACETGVSREAVADELRLRVAVTLHHVHLPKAVAADVVAYDEESDTVTLGPAAEALSAYVDLTLGREREHLPKAVVE